MIYLGKLKYHFAIAKLCCCARRKESFHHVAIHYGKIAYRILIHGLVFCAVTVIVKLPLFDHTQFRHPSFTSGTNKQQQNKRCNKSLGTRQPGNLIIKFCQFFL